LADYDAYEIRRPDSSAGARDPAYVVGQNRHHPFLLIL
jgi:hypothetical protein